MPYIGLLKIIASFAGRTEETEDLTEPNEDAANENSLYELNFFIVF